ncbi:MAG: prepilin-type N-terminal cleavage/methylation domain-containing protein [Candidatus Omnitrophica bacterium]|nr:prepilin-type N-terminal cleavage/methylation domain-containing protein [Candidatus Omnitrophota bacterium]
MLAHYGSQPFLSKKAFTLLELMIVIGIIAILAATVIPNFVGFDTEARLAASKTNLSNLRTRVTLFRSKEGRYPERLEELLEVNYNDLGIERPYLDYMPPEFISSKAGNAEVEDMKSDGTLTGDGGWMYITDKAKVIIDWDQPLDNRWGNLKGEVPSEW